MAGHKLSLQAAVLVNINVMVGAGVFVNTVLLARAAGMLGAVAYAVMGIILLPLIITFARLMKHYQGGTFYDYTAPISPLMGFISGWTYFVAKLASAALGIHVFSTLMQQFIPSLAAIPTVIMDSTIVIFFALFNMLNVKIGQSIQFGFLFFKAIPIAFAIGVGSYLYFISSDTSTAAPLAVTGIATSLPFVLYAFTGFEACCSLSRTIDRPEYNGPRAIIISYAIGVTIAVLYQLMFYSGLGSQLGSLPDYSAAFPALLTKFMPTATMARKFLFGLLNIGIASSSLGAAYGIMYSNSWNLYVLGANGHTFYSRLITRFNRYSIPAVCVCIEGIIALAYVIIFRGNQVPLQQMLSLGMIITYTLSTVAFLMMLITTKSSQSRLVPLLALASCLLLVLGYLKNIMTFGIMPTSYFIGLLLFGIGMFLFTRKPKNASAQ